MPYDFDAGRNGAEKGCFVSDCHFSFAKVTIFQFFFLKQERKEKNFWKQNSGKRCRWRQQLVHDFQAITLHHAVHGVRMLHDARCLPSSLLLLWLRLWLRLWSSSSSSLLLLLLSRCMYTSHMCVVHTSP